MPQEAAAAGVTGGRRVVALRNVSLPSRSGRWTIRFDGANISGIEAEAGARLARDEAVADGLLAVPGFHDAHVHVLAAARAATVPRLMPTLRGVDELGRAIASAAALTHRGWLHIAGFDSETMTDGWIPDRLVLDRFCTDRPIRLQHRNLRLDVLNSEAIRRCRLAREPGVELADGLPTGRIFQNGAAIREPDGEHADSAARVDRWSRELLRHGVTSIHDAGEANGVAELTLLNALADEGVLRQRVCLMVGGRSLDEPPSPDCLRRTTHAKLAAIETRVDPEELELQARHARDLGLGVAIHATTEAEIAAAVHTIRCAQQHDGALAAPPWTYRIEHASVVSDAAAEAVKAVGAGIAANPTFVAVAGDSYLEAHPPNEHAWLHRLGSWLRLGVPIALASDAPVTPSRPLAAIDAACSRLTGSGRTLGAREAIDEETALSAVTTSRLAVGQRADVVLLRTHGSRLRGAEVVATIVGGMQLWDEDDM